MMFFPLLSLYMVGFFLLNITGTTAIALNSARNKTVTMSSVNWPGTFAVDGNLSTDRGVCQCCAGTDKQDDPWLRVDLGSKYSVLNVVIYGRTDLENDTVQNYNGMKIFLNEYEKNVTEAVDTIPDTGATWYYKATLVTPVTARFVTIRLGVDKRLVVCEIQVFTQGINVALWKTVAISSTFSNNFKASHAVDGKLLGSLASNTCYCCAATIKQWNPWIRVDLGGVFRIFTLVIYGRTGLGETFNNMNIYLHPTKNKGNPVRTFKTSGVYINVKFDPDILARYVTLQQMANLMTAYCEVEVYGECPSGTFGSVCRTCNCDGPPCDIWVGVCPSGKCLPGYIGDSCDQECPSGTYGQNCSEQCGQCLNMESCNNVEGTCTLCSAGYTGNFCKTECSNRTFGLNCSEQCGNCYGDEQCSVTSGECLGQCSPGYSGPHCTFTCTDRTYGQNCSEVCGQCLDGATCDVVNGTCTACEAGYQGRLCKTDANIALKKSVEMRSTRSQIFIGSNAVDGRLPGEQSPGTCGCCAATTQETDPWLRVDLGVEFRLSSVIIYGRNNSEYFNQVNVSVEIEKGIANVSRFYETSPAITNVTFDPDILGRYIFVQLYGNVMAMFCEIEVFGECPSGTFGPDCKACHCDGSPCDIWDGVCPSGKCLPGYLGVSCDQECANKTYGQNCSLPCGNCLSTCNHVNGACDTCTSGYTYTDISCKIACDNGTYGFNCNTTCGHCYGEQVCDKVIGSCGGMCAAGYKGDNCNKSTNVAYKASVSTSSVLSWTDWGPGNAVDGIIPEDLDGQTCQCCAATQRELSPWLRIDFGSIYMIFDIIIYWKSGQGQGIYDVKLYLHNSSDDYDRVFTTVKSDTNVLNETLVRPVKARYLTLLYMGFTTLAVCELQAYTGECRQGTYGSMCEHDCHCAGPTCNTETGYCPSGVCLSGYTGQRCNQAVNSKKTYGVIIGGIIGPLFLIVIIIIIVVILYRKHFRVQITEQRTYEFFSMESRLQDTKSDYNTIRNLSS